MARINDGGNKLGLAAAVLAVVALLLAAGPYLGKLKKPAPEAAAAPALAKVVYHADFADPRRFSAMLTSINNMVTTYQSDLVEYDVRIVFVSHGIRFVTDDPLRGTLFAEDALLKERRQDLRSRLQSLQEVQGVKLELCNITRVAVNLDEAKLMAGVELVQSGVVRLAELQHQGFAYLKIE
ncbi:MAG: DsrE family protein [Gammaproteobacteria bacterium]|nr:DsrE family protein [Gammaproteobacteria bacterium]